MASYHAATGQGYRSKRRRRSSGSRRSSEGNAGPVEEKYTYGTFSLDTLQTSYESLVQQLEPSKAEMLELRDGDMLEQLQKLMDLRLVGRTSTDPLATSGYTCILSSEAATELRKRMQIILPE